MGALSGAPILLFGQWQKVAVPSGASFRAVQAADSLHAWIGGTSGTVLRSADAGLSWRNLSPRDSDSLDFRSVYGFPGGKKAVVMSIGESEKGLARIYHTSDGGENWRLAFSTSKTGVFLNCMAFWDERNGLCMGDPVDGRFYLLRTRNGGMSWEEVPFAERPEALAGEIAFAASGSTLVVTSGGGAFIGTGGRSVGRVLWSTDFAKTWQAADTPIRGGASSGIFGIFFRDSQVGFALGGDYRDFRAGYDNVACTQDGGRTWQNGGAIPPSGLKESAGVYDNRLLVTVGHSGSALSPDWGKSWTVLDYLPYHACSFSGTTGIAVGVGGLVSRFVVELPTPTR